MLHVCDTRKRKALIKMYFFKEIKAVELIVYFYHHSMQQPPAFPQHMDHFKPQINIQQDISQQVRNPNPRIEATETL